MHIYNIYIWISEDPVVSTPPDKSKFNQVLFKANFFFEKPSPLRSVFRQNDR